MKLPGSIVNRKITQFLLPKNRLALRTAVSHESKIRNYLNKPSQRNVAKSMLPLNLGRRPISLKTSIITGKIPTLPRGTHHFLGAFNTMSNNQRKRELRHVQKRMINNLPNGNNKKQLNDLLVRVITAEMVRNARQGLLN